MSGTLFIGDISRNSKPEQMNEHVLTRTILTEKCPFIVTSGVGLFYTARICTRPEFEIGIRNIAICLSENINDYYVVYSNDHRGILLNRKYWKKIGDRY
jgi:hypothetical protein